MTTNISKIQAALASVTQETTLALFNLNLDCSLIKVDAPAEYLPFGNALTKRRRTQAEAGSAHRIARKLGMLFEGIVPQTPELIKAYGTRATDIIEFHRNQLSSKSGGKTDYGPFTDYVGVDGTSIWAAATSSGAAIAMHLLACLLATTFTAEEAVATWEQIVQTRKEEILKSETGDLYGFRTLAASTWDIPRQDLTNWDASARAWLRSADLAKELQCHQLRLILDNINLPVHTSTETYQSVIETWQICLKMMDSLIRGNGQEIQNGGLLVAFKAWHIFPDMILLKDNKHVKQKDPLVKLGGIVTIGLERADCQDTTGVNWSLSLSHLQFYGEFERREGCLDSTKERVSIPDVWVFLLGFCFAVAGANMVQVERKVEIALAISQRLLSYAQNPPKGYISLETLDIETSWPYRLNQACKRYLGCTGDEQKRLRQLMTLGNKSFNRAFPGRCLAVSIGEMARHIGKHFNDMLPNFLKRFIANTRTPATITITYTARTNGLGFEWTLNSADIEDGSNISKFGKYLTGMLSRPLIVAWDMTKPPKCVKALNTPCAAQRQILRTLVDAVEFRAANSIDDLLYQDHGCQTSYIVLWENVSEDTLNRIREGHQRSETLPGISDIEFLLRENLLGGEHVMRKILEFDKTKPDVTEYLVEMSRVSVLYEKFDTPLIDLSHLATCFIDRSRAKEGLRPRTKRPNFFPVVQSDSRLNEIVAKFEYPARKLLFPSVMTQSEAFQWIHCLESKGTTPRDNLPSFIMAISSEDSIFVASQLLQDPSISITSPESIIRIPGNIGRAGVILIVSPPNLRYPYFKDTLLEDTPFDGQLIDCFRNTTLHLTLTGYELPLEDGKIGARHNGTWIFEATTSVHDSGKWVGDIDPLVSPYFYSKKLENGLRSLHPIDFFHIPDSKYQGSKSSPALKCNSCLTATDDSYSDSTFVKTNVYDGVTSIDCWGEYFNRPSNPTVFRAKGNWAARLAALCFSESIKAPIIPIHPQTCKCRVEWLLNHPGPPDSKHYHNDEWLCTAEGATGIMRGEIPVAARPPNSSTSSGPDQDDKVDESRPYPDYRPIYLL
ncbi:hypothetical protein TWF281_000912 [Arthrobotrys megalospora]